METRSWGEKRVLLEGMLAEEKRAAEKENQRGEGRRVSHLL